MAIQRPRLQLLDSSAQPYDFISIKVRGRNAVGTVLRPLQRVGATGTAFREEGASARPFVMRCLRDAPNLYLAEEWLEFMTQRVKGKRCKVRLHGGWWLKYLVCLDIVAPEMEPIVRGVGGVYTNPKAVFTVDLIMQEYKPNLSASND